MRARPLAALAAVLVGAVVLTGCSTGSVAEKDAVEALSEVDEGAFPVTIERVVTIGWNEHDFVAAFVYLQVSTADTSRIHYLTPLDPRSRVLEQLGLAVAPVVRRLSEGSKEYFGSISSERAGDLDSDLAIIMPAEPVDADGLDQLLAEDPLLSRIPAYAADTWYPATEPTQMLSLSGASPLSLPWAAHNVVPELAAVAARVDG